MLLEKVFPAGPSMSQHTTSTHHARVTLSILLKNPIQLLFKLTIKVFVANRKESKIVIFGFQCFQANFNCGMKTTIFTTQNVPTRQMLKKKFFDNLVGGYFYMQQ